MIYRPINDQDPSQKEFYESYFAMDPVTYPTYKYSLHCENGTDIYVITFNNPLLVEYQIKTLRKFFKAPFNLIVVDNNNWLYPEQSERVLALCIQEGVIYVKAPDNYYQHKENFDPSMKLGTTMNWLYVNCIQDRQPAYFGFLDHDCFLVRKLDLRPWLDKKGMYGRVIRSKVSKAWTLHVTTNFYKFDTVRELLLDFRAAHEDQLDTGGANYNILYKHLSPDDYEIERKSIRFAEADVNRKDSVQHYEMIGGAWYHMAASSHDQLAGDGLYKLAYTKGYLDSRLQKR
jgi:hypothetical protein